MNDLETVEIWEILLSAYFLLLNLNSINTNLLHKGIFSNNQVYHKAIRLFSFLTEQVYMCRVRNGACYGTRSM